MSSILDKRLLNAAFSPNRGFKDDFEASRLKAIGQRKEEIKRIREKEFDYIDGKVDLLNKTSQSPLLSYSQFVTKSVETTQKVHQTKPLPKSPQSGTGDKTPPIAERAGKLKEKVPILRIEGVLSAFNKMCYDDLTPEKVVELYRSNVDFSLDSDKSMTTIKQLYDCLLSDETIPEVTRKRNLRIAVLKNGVLDVESMTLLPHSPENIVCYYIDANYVENSECPDFDKFVFETFGGNKTYIKRFWMSLGYIFLETLEAKVFFFMGRARDSGKSLVGRFIESLYPERYVSNIELNDFNRDFAIAPIVGAALNTALDMPAIRLNPRAVSKLKKFTGGDGFNVNQKHVPEFKYRNSAKFLFASNHPIILNEDDDAFWSRLVYLPFNFTVPCEERDSRLLEKFQREKDAIVSKALRYAKKLIDNKFQFPTDYELEKEVQSWRGRTSDSIEYFLDERCSIAKEYKGELVKKLYSHYEDYCDNNNYTIASYNVFKQYLENITGLKHFKMRDGGENTQSAFKGIRIL